MGAHQAKRLPQNKENHQQNEKATYWIRESICKAYMQQGANIQNT